jgi:hypothetical protein
VSDLRQISSLDVREPGVRFMIGFYKAFHATVAVDCEWDEHSTAGYNAGKKAKEDMQFIIAEKYRVTFHQVRPA